MYYIYKSPEKVHHACVIPVESELFPMATSQKQRPGRLALDIPIQGSLGITPSMLSYSARDVVAGHGVEILLEMLL